MPAVRPLRILVSIDDQTLVIDWSDGYQAVYPLDGLRRACPCVTCQGGHEHMGAPPDPRVLDAPPRRTWTDVRLEAAGSVGLRITWDDGHDTGLYTWGRLRALRPPPDH